MQNDFFDKKGRLVYPGDLIRSFHFKDKKRKIYYLYHTVVLNLDYRKLELVPTSELEPSKQNQGGRCWIRQELLDGIEAEIIAGCGPSGNSFYEDRPKRKLYAN